MVCNIGSVSSPLVVIYYSLFSLIDFKLIAFSSKSEPILLEHGIQLGSLLEPLLYSKFTAPLLSVVSKYNDICSHLYANDIQIYLSFSPE